MIVDVQYTMAYAVISSISFEILPSNISDKETTKKNDDGQANNEKQKSWKKICGYEKTDRKKQWVKESKHGRRRPP